MQVTPQALVEAQHPNEIQVREKSGVQYALHAPLMVGDTLTGIVRGVRTTSGGRVVDSARRIPLSSVERMTFRRGEAGTSVLLVLGGLGIALLIMGMKAGAAD